MIFSSHIKIQVLNTTSNKNKMKNNIVTKCLSLMKLQATCLGVNLDNQNLIYSPKRLDNPKFVDFLAGCEYKKNEEILKNQSSQIQIPHTNLYEIKTSSSEVYEYKNGETKCISNPKPEQSARDYIAQKLMAIQTLKDQLDFKNEVKTKFNKN